MVKASQVKQDSFKTDQIPPGEPVGLTVVYQGTRTIIVEWNKPEASLHVLDHYEVQWGRNGVTKESKTTKKCYICLVHKAPNHYTLPLQSQSSKKKWLCK